MHESILYKILTDLQTPALIISGIVIFLLFKMINKKDEVIQSFATQIEETTNQLSSLTELIKMLVYKGVEK